MNTPRLSLTTRAVDASVIYPLRTRILRPHFPDGELAIWDGDDAPSTTHVALVDGRDRVLGCATFMRSEFERERALRLRGMAIEDGFRGEGLGALLLTEAMELLSASNQRDAILWCNAREAARTFYEKMGFTCHGDPFELPDIGLHHVMWRRLAGPRA